MFEQVERRSEERMRRELKEGLARLSRNKAASRTSYNQKRDNTGHV